MIAISRFPLTGGRLTRFSSSDGWNRTGSASFESSVARLSRGGEVAQLVEHTAENRGVAGSIPALAISLTLLGSAAMELAFLSAVEQARLVQDGQASSSELVEHCLARIGELDPVLNAFVTVCAEDARAEAARIDGGSGDQPFRGVPIAIKDLAATAGIRTAFSSHAYADYVPDFDTAVVRRLRDAGFVIVGKTNTPEFGTIAFTESDLNGATHNPWATDLTPGGSSGGAAAALAAGLVSAAHATDGGGSIRIPASCCGLFGLKPA